ncbi:hypothetical protein [Parasphingorhabdus sp.]|uniref:hypothetical protein n=1 Tax=Parasphingorhabdus sp. TaxID=2709688 RepID=UPI003266923B
MSDRGLAELARKTIRKMASAHYGILRTSMSLRGQSEITPGYASRLATLDSAILRLSRGKWLYGRSTGELADFATRTSSENDLAKASDSFDEANAIARAMMNDDTIHGVDDRYSLTKRNGLIWFDDTPIVPSICPIVILSGSSFDMGRQYAHQCIDIFGPFVFETAAGKSFSALDRDHLQAWIEQASRLTPEILQMAEGMAAGATRQGVALDADHAFALWVGTLAPATEPAPIGVLDADGGGVMGAYFGDHQIDSNSADIGEGMCSAAAAWGQATRTGELCFSSSTDHDCTFQATIIAYPDEGHPFIYTPFSVNGSVPGVGRFGFAGHPGFNTAGLAYVHHGGGGACTENHSEWGHGVPRGISTLHNLRFASSAKDAIDREVVLPTGDVGHVLGAPGGFYADDKGGYVLESRNRPEAAIRTHSESPSGAVHDFLYATNNVISQHIDSDVFPPGPNTRWDAIQGWEYMGANAEADGVGLLTRRFWSTSSVSRNRYFYDRLIEKNGQLDLAAMLDLFRRGPDRGNVTWPEAEQAMANGGDLHRPSAAHRLNAFVAAGEPSRRSYMAAIGPITHRSVSPNRPGHGYFLYDETNAYWQVELADTIGGLVKQARDDAANLITSAEKALGECNLPKDGEDRLRGFLLDAKHSFSTPIPALTAEKAKDDELAATARALRGFTRAQVRARQILQALAPPEEWDHCLARTET